MPMTRADKDVIATQAIANICIKTILNVEWYFTFPTPTNVLPWKISKIRTITSEVEELLNRLGDPKGYFSEQFYLLSLSSG